jgi:membrane protease YdiL (CAAX protease family)
MCNRLVSRFINLQLFVSAHPLIKLFFVIFSMLTSFLIISFLSMLLAIPLFHLSFSELKLLYEGNLLESDIAFLKYLQISQSLSLFVIPSILLNYLLFSQNNNCIATGKIPPVILIGLVFATLLVSSSFINLLIEWNSAIKFPVFLADFEAKMQQMESNANELTQKLLSGKQISDYIFNLLMIAVIPAIGEEFLFRGVIQRIFADWFKNLHAAIILTAILFSSFHLQFYGFVPRFILGLFFGYLYLWRKNIWIAVLAHFFNNAIAITSDFLNKIDKYIIPNSVKENLGTNNYGIFICLFFTGILVFLIYQFYRIKPVKS